MITIRRAADAEAPASVRLSHEAFGYPAPDPASVVPLCSEAQIMYVAEDASGAIVGKCRDRFYHSWFGGRQVPTAGVASVTVAMEARGQGVMRELMRALQEGARERGAVISCLVPTVPAAYRRFGYETITTFDKLRVPTVLLSHVRPGAGSLRRATRADADAIHACYESWASRQNGPLTRAGVSFPAGAGALFDEGEQPATTVALDEAGSVRGFAVWERSGHYADDGLITVHDLTATTTDAMRLLLAGLGASYQVAPTTALVSSGLDQLRMLLPDRLHAVVDQEDYMCAVLDVGRAFTERDYPPVDGEVTFRVRDALLAGVDGCYRLTVTGGAGECRRVEETGCGWFTAGGLAACYAGAQSLGNLEMLGLAGGFAQPWLLDAWFGGRQVHIRDTY